VSLVALKTSSLNTLKQRFLTLLVSDWKDMTTFTPGLKGGQRYFIHKQSKTEDKQMTASTIKKQFSEIKCFLLPKHSAELDVAYKQQMSALLRLVLEQKPPIQTDEDGNAVKLIRTLLESPNAPLSNYTAIDEAELEWLAERNVSYEDEENDIKETESDSEDPDSQSTVESAYFFGKSSEEPDEDLLQLGDNSFSMEHDSVGVPSVEADFWADLDGFGASSEFEGLSDGSNRQANEKDAGEKMLNLQEKASVEDPTNSALLEKVILVFDETGMGHFEKKIAEVENAYRKLNDQITEEEASKIEFTQNLAVKLYQEIVRIDDISSQDELLRLHGKWEKIVKDACIKAYCGDSGNKSIMNQLTLQLAKKLVDLHEQNKMQLEERLETNKIRTILVRNLVSRYESELDRSAVRNPAIFTPEQFNEMSNNYRHEAMRKFEESLKPLSSSEAKEELRKVMDSELNKVFGAKQEEFNKKKKVVSSPDSSSATTSDETMEFEEETENAQSQPQIPAQVGIHFGFNFLSAVALVDGSSRTVYGPSPNTISFQSQNETFIGENPSSSSAKVIRSFSELFKNLDLNRKYCVPNSPNWGYCQIEELVALVLAHLHRVVGRLLHTNNIAYVIAFPSCFNGPALTAMNYAVQIAGLNAKIVRDTCGLTAYFIRDCYSAVFANSFKKIVFTIVENESDESSDVVGYEISNQVVSPFFLCGDYPLTSFLLISDSKPGLFPLVEKIKKNSVYVSYHFNQSSAISVVLHCSGSNQERNMNIIKAAMPGVKVHFYPSNTINTKPNLTVGKGAALLAGYKFNPKFSQDWDRDHPEITLRGFDQDISGSNNRNYRMMHCGLKVRVRAHQVSELSQKVQSQVAAYHRSLEKEKSRGKAVYMEKSNQIQDSNMKQSDKIRASRYLSALLKEMDEEELSLSRIRDIIDRMKNL
jgi:hypothetical protein